ncbi:Hsp70 family protein [Corynebacterium pyruviciproducens]|uniref:Hsp70 family protein n=1 Tax=Corynebacterium pyruviciproducens TaxID=598660 RepID=UPI002456E628|nr:Hsp70 family protein [Corynebacterium pyruviciproducens]MDH4658664.1 Hsp70 family protein [Corynebacterium pyruviciproducens]
MTFPWSLSIDFGTSNTTAAHTNPVSGQVEVASISHDRLTMGSHVFVAADGSCVVGDEAWNLAEADPAGLVRTPKRLVMEESVRVRGEEVPVARIVSAVVGEVIRKVSAAHDGEAPQEVMVTHPERWSEKEIDTLREAVVLAGVDRGAVFTLSEAVAAAYYYTRANRLSVGDRIGVFDFGGGTLDVAVLRFAGGGDFSVEAHDGDPALGGRSFDDAVREWVFEQLEDDDPDLLDYLRLEASESELIDLSRQIEKAKELLSDASSAVIMIQTRRGSHPVQITREDFSGVVGLYVDRAVGLVKRVLHSARVFSAGDLRALYLTGGSSRVPVVQEALKELGTVRLDNPKTVVALGALNYLINEAGKQQLSGGGGAGVSASGVGSSRYESSNAEGRSHNLSDGTASERSSASSLEETSNEEGSGQMKKSGSVVAGSVIGAFAIVGVVVVLIVAYFALSSCGGGNEAANSTQAATPTASATPTPTATPRTSPTASPTTTAASTVSEDDVRKGLPKSLAARMTSDDIKEHCSDGTLTIMGEEVQNGVISCDLTPLLSGYKNALPGPGGGISYGSVWNKTVAQKAFDQVTSDLNYQDDQVLRRFLYNDDKCVAQRGQNEKGVYLLSVCPGSGFIRLESGFKDEDSLSAYKKVAY